MHSLLYGPSSPFLPPPLVLLLSLRFYLLSLPASSHFFDLFPLTHFFPLSHSHTLCPGGIQLSAVNETQDWFQTHTNGRVTKTRLDTGNRLKEEREAEGGGRERDSSSASLWLQIEKNQRKAWPKKPGEEYEGEHADMALAILRNVHTVNILWRLETEQQGR